MTDHSRKLHRMESGGTEPDLRLISTGCLPHSVDIPALLAEAHARFRDVADGENSPIYPALAQMPRSLFGLCLADTAGRTHQAGEAAQEFVLMSVAKPFVFALVCEALGPETVRQKIGVNATGRSFNSLEAIAESADGRTNPMVNSGAIATATLAPGKTVEEKWRFLHEGLCRFAGRPLEINEDVRACAMATNHRNREIAQMLEERGGLFASAQDAVELYTRQCALSVSAEDLALMAATLADGGVQPRTGEQVVSAPVCHFALAVMATAGLYETSGDWLFDIGLPGKSGISGGLMAVAPGKCGIGVFSPPLDGAGNSVRGQRAAQFLSQRLGLSVFLSRRG